MIDQCINIVIDNITKSFSVCQPVDKNVKSFDTLLDLLAYGSVVEVFSDELDELDEACVPYEIISTNVAEYITDFTYDIILAY